MSEFNAWTEWLDIPADKQPPNHYALLGVMQFESDVDAIKSALASRQELLKSHADAGHRDAARMVQDALDAASQCLLDADAKTAYDQQLLEARFFSTPAPKPAEPKRTEPKPARPRPEPKPAEPEPSAAEPPAETKTAEPALSVPAPAAEESEPSTVPRPAGRQSEKQPARGMPKPTALEPAGQKTRQPVLDEPFDFSPEDDAAATKVKCPECGVTLKLKNRISLGETHPCPECEIPFVLDADSVRESYELDLESVRNKPEPPKPKPLPRTPKPKPEEEEKPVIKRRSPKKDSELQAEKEKPKPAEASEPVPTTKRRKRIFDLKNNPLGAGLAAGGVIAVVMLLLNMLSPASTPLAPLPGPVRNQVADTSPSSPRSNAAPRRGTADDPETTTDPATAAVPTGDEPEPGTSEDPEPGNETEPVEAPKGNVLDLIPLADLASPNVIGDWNNDDGALSAAGVGLGQLPIEVGLPDTYDLTLELDQLRGSNGVGIGLQVGGQHVVAVIDGWSAQASGLSQIDGQPADANESTAFGPQLSQDSTNLIECSVGPDFVRISCNALQVVDWQGDPATLHLPNEYQSPTNSAVFLGTDNTAYRVTRFELSSDSDFPPEPQPLSTGNDSTVPIPNNDALAEAVSLVREVFQSDINDAKTPDQKVALADRLVEQGQDKENNDAAARYVMLKRARDLAVFAGDVDKTLEIMDAMQQDFRIRTHSSRATVFEALRENARTPQTLVALAGTTAKAAGEAIDVEDFAAANSMLKTVDEIADRIRGRELQPVLSSLRRDIAARQTLWDEFSAAGTALKADPFNSSAWLDRGRYLCFARGRWRAGLQAFSHTTESDFTALVNQDLASPSDPQGQLKLADAWWDWIQLNNDRQEFNAFPHHWYTRALPSLAGLAKAKAEKRIEQLGTPKPIRPVE